MSRRIRAWAALLAVMLFVPASGSTQQVRTPSHARVFAVGDLLYRGLEFQTDEVGRLTERLYRDNPDSTILLLGDVCNADGTRECYDDLQRTSWGPLFPVAYPVMGNHDNEQAILTGRMPELFSRFPLAGRPGVGEIALTRGAWRLLGYNTELMRRDRVTNTFIDPGKALGHLKWLDGELQKHHKTQCILAFGHRPPYSSFRSPGSESQLDPYAMPIFRKLYKHGVDLNLTAHMHGLNWLPPLHPDGQVDRSNGVPIGIVGTGGAIPFVDPRLDTALRKPERRLKWAADDEVLLANTPGVVQLDLYPGSFTWKFIPVSPQPGVAYPSGSGKCHDNPSGYAEPAVS